MTPEIESSQRVSIMLPKQPESMSSVEEFARRVGPGAAHTLWLGQSFSLDTLMALAHLAGSGFSLPLGLGVALTPLSSPYHAALQLRTLAQLTGAPVSASFGTATPSAVASLTGRAYGRPARALEEYVSVVRSLLESGHATLDGEYFQIDAALNPIASNSVQPVVEVGAGVLRPAAARAAGRSADLITTWLAPPTYIQNVLIEEMSKAGRRARTVAIVPFALARPGRTAVHQLNAAIGLHVSLPHYAEMLRLAGMDVIDKAPNALAGELRHRGVFAFGDADTVWATVDDYFASGVDEVVLSPAGVFETQGQAAALHDIDDLLSSAGSRVG
ncbi:LLM class flavin-dependent oxidoreductase [Leifsonia sp. NPDC056824]|uniref:LLM class flavin-dependent oxidoreductase n=1 Tax=Leifsonia sp. NPDC056824 TaxID=3345953 RepID=UPI0036A2D591